MNDSIVKLICFSLVLLGITGSVVASARGGIGFQATLKSPPLVVSAYDDQDDRFSVALQPRTHAVLSTLLKFDPDLDYSSFDNNALTFATKFSRDKYLVPISVDANLFAAYRMAIAEQRRQAGLFQTSLADARRRGRRQGLSIGVDLPKRFDRMFGEGGANLRVSGYRRITFSGRSQWNDAANSGALRQSKFPSLNMEQISRFEINGTIGSKISVKVAQDNQTEIPLANRVELRYKGDEDDVLQRIEAGNTTLSLPNTRFVGYTSRIQGLFGLKAEAQLGNLRVTGIASQEKGSSETSVISAGGEENAAILRDYAYAEGRIFDLFYPGEFGPDDRVTRIFVYQFESRTDNTQAKNALLQIDPNNPLADTVQADSLLMKEVDADSYELLYGQNPLRSPVAIVFYTTQRRAIGVYMEVVQQDGFGGIDTLKIGSLGATLDTLKYLRAKDDNWLPSHPTWSLMWRNCYRIPKNAAIEDIDLRVLKGLQGREGTTSSLDYQSSQSSTQGKYLQILGLDQYNNNLPEIKKPDNKLDDRPDVFRPEWGLVIFPHREPFNTDTTFVNQDNERTSRLSDPVADIYYYQSQSQKLDNSKYYTQTSSRSRSSQIRLGRANILENSERITLNGRILKKGVDYTIAYDFGQVTLLSDEALDPNAELNIEFEYAPFLALQKKTLLGLRADYEWSPDLRFGTSILYKSDKAEDRKPRVGQETARATILDFDFAFKLYPQFLTSAVNALPLVSTEAKSRIQVSGEIAQSRPNPNVEGAAYVDDFESAVEILSLGVIRTNWTESSLPLPLQDDPTYSRGTLRWHNPPAILRETVYDTDVAAGQGNLIPLRLIFRPKGQQPILDGDTCTDQTTPTNSWGGIMRYFGSRVDEKRAQLFEVRARGGSGTLHFDFGRISEDIDGNGSANTEDRSFPRNFALDDGEDLGLDTIPDEIEVNECGIGYDPTANPDPAGDNWWFNGRGNGAGSEDERPPIPLGLWNDPSFMANGRTFRQNVEDRFHHLYYEWQNGTDGNLPDDVVQGIPDEEDLSGTGLNEVNAYYSFVLSMDTSTLSNPFVVPGSGNEDGWYTYRIPIRDPDIADTVTTDGSVSPNWAQITHVRVWFDNDLPGADSLLQMDSVWIADWGFVQSNWQDTLVFAEGSNQTSEFFVASVSEADGTFTPPDGVEAYVDKVQNVTESQRGLSLVYTNFQTGDTALATKELITTESYSGYRRMEMFVHGPDNIGSDSLLFMFRLGRDSANFYEYQSYIRAGWHTNNHVNIDFNEITALKDAADRAADDNASEIDTTDFPYRVKGRPNINEIRVLVAGVVNTGPLPVTGDIWLDELRVTEVRKDIGTAARIDVTGSLADLVTYSVGYEKRDAYFRGLSAATRGGSRNNLGSGRETTRLNYSARMSLDRFLPRSWGASLPISYSVSTSEEIPLLRNNSDVVLPEEIRAEETNTSESQKFSVSESFNKKGGNLLFNVLLNRQKLSFSYNRTERTTVNNPLRFGENISVRGEYNMGITRDVGIPIFFWTRSLPLLKKVAESKLSLLPHTWRWTGDFRRSLSVTDDRDLRRTSSHSRNFDAKMTMGLSPFPKLKTNYNFSTKRDFTDPDRVHIALKNLKLGHETAYSQSFSASYDPDLFNFFSSSISGSARYSDRYDQSTKTLSTSLARTWTVSGNFRHQVFLGQGKGYGGYKAKTGRSGRATKRVGRGPNAPKTGEDGEEEEEKKGDGKPFYQPALTGLRFLTGWLDPVSYKYTEKFSKSIPGAVNRPDWKYRFGVNTDTDVEIGETSRNEGASEAVNYELGSGFRLFGGITTTIKYRRSIDRDLIKVGKDKLERSSTSWPDLTIRIGQFSYFPLVKNQLNWFIRIFAPRTAYSRTLRESMNIDQAFRTDHVETINRNPLLSVNFKVLRALSLSGSYSVTKTFNDQYNRTTGDLQSETNSTRNTIAVSTKYTFSSGSGISIPLFGKLKFKSTMSIDLNVKYSSNLSESSSAGGPFVISVEKSDFSVSPVIRYSFSQQISGGLSATWQDNNDAKFNRKSHTRRIDIYTEIHF